MGKKVGEEDEEVEEEELKRLMSVWRKRSEL